MKRFVFFLVLLLFVLFPRSIAADEGWGIDNFQSDIAVQESGQVRVVETIEVDFRNLDKHGIYREIPYIYESEGEKTYTEIAVSSILQNNTKAKYETSRNDGYIQLKIGDPDRTISGKNVYVLTYTAKGVLRSFAEHDELYWNVTGNNSPVTINRVEAVVTVPKEGITRIICYEGYSSSQGECQSKQESPQLARFNSTGPLDEARGMTVVAGYTKGMVPILTVERPKSFWEKFTEWPSLATIFIVLFSGIITVLYRWHKHGRDYWFAQNIFGKKDDQGVVKPFGSHETVTVEFVPPENLRPGIIGVLMDERAQTHDVVATIIDLAARGYLTITEIPKKWLFGKVDYQLNKKQKPARNAVAEATAGGDEKELLGYEKKLLHNLFNTGDEVKVSSLKTTFYDDLEEVKKELYKEVVDMKLFPTDPEKVRSNYVMIAVVLLFVGLAGVGFSVSTDFVFGADIALGVVVSGILLLAMSRHMPRRTAYGHELYRRARGYHLFINTAEKHRQKFFEKKNMFNEVLPYAIAFGLTEKFAKQMHEMGIQPSTTGWYSGVHPITSSHFASSMSDFSSSMSTAIASTPSSSGGFSSGGSSGGGFGGGGTGSW